MARLARIVVPGYPHLGSEKFVLRFEKKLDRILKPKKAGRPKKNIRKVK